MPPIVRDLIEAARIRHWSFTEIELGDGAALLFLNQRQRTHLANYGAEIEALVGVSRQYTVSRNATGSIIALLNGVPAYATTAEDGYAVHLDGNGVPYIDTAEAPIAGDPFGQSGGTPGFPLPLDMVRLISVGLVYGSGGRNIPCDVIPERERWSVLPGRNPAAFLSGNRLVPVFPMAGTNSGDRWQSVTAIQISYIAMPTLTAVTDTITLPTLLCEALTADVAALFAGQSRTCTPVERAAFRADAANCAAAIASASLGTLDAVETSHVLFRP